MKNSEHILKAVDQVRQTLRFSVIEGRVGTLLSTVVPLFVVVVGCDRLLRFPSLFRWIILLGMFVGVVWAFRRHLLPALRFRPSRVQVALRIEDRIPSLSGRLATGVDFLGGSQAQTNPLVDRTIRDLDHRVGSTSFSDVVRTSPSHRRAILASAILVVLTLSILWRPDFAGTAALRLFAPWIDIRWPARTEVASNMPDRLVHPRGEPLALAANLLKGEPGRDRVSVRIRRLGDGVDPSWRSLVMTPQQEGVHERIIDTDVDTIEYQFTSPDWETALATIELVPAPRLRSASVEVNPPSYADRLGILAQELDVGIGRRSRLDRSVLEGSTVELSLELDRPVPIPRNEFGLVDEAFVDRTVLMDTASDTEIDISPDDPTRWTVRWTLTDSTDVEIALEDEHGIANIDPIRYRFPVVKDRVPSVTIVDPNGDRRVTVDATVPVAADAVDDVGLDLFVIEATIEGGSSNAMDAVELQRFAPREDGSDLADASIATSLAVRDFPVGEGDSILLTAIAADRRPVENPEVRSATRRLQIVSERVIVDEIQSALASVRRDAIRLEDDQAGLEDAVRENGVDGQIVRGQERLGERLEGTMEALDGIDRRRRENQVGDEMLAELLDQARERIEAATAASESATTDLDRANRSEAGNDPESTDVESATESQREVRDELADLAATLDRGEDAWVVSRQIERLAEDLADLQQQTGELADRTMGRDRSDLSEEERREVDDLARQQSSLAERSRELIEDLEQRSESLSQIDPNESSALEEAAEQARREGLESEMREAAEAAQENRLRQAGQSQQRASEALERMQETMEEIRKAKVEELRRRMESLVESLESLVSASEDGLAILSRIEDDRDTEAIRAHSDGLVRLQRNTMSVAVDAAQAEERIGRLVDRASDRQGQAVSRLRSAPPRLDEARDAQEQALQQLQEALDLARAAAERLAEQQAAEERDQLLATYREIRDRQIGIQIETMDLMPAEDADIGRRDRINLRRLATREGEIGVAMTEIAEEFTEVEDSLVFSMTHRRLDVWIDSVATSLRDADPSIEVVESQTMIIEAITGLVDALEESQPPEEPFAQDGGGGGGSGGEESEGGPQPLIPPIAELKMLKSMQRQILDATKRVDALRAETASNEAVERRLADLSEMQSDLHGVATALITSMEPTPLENSPRTDTEPPKDVEDGS